MCGWLYLIKNRDLHKIGITKNLDNRMRQLKPDYIVAKIYSSNFRQLEKELHNRYKDVRIPQTEYFRLDKVQIKEIKKIIQVYSNSVSLFRIVFIRSFCLLLFIFIIFFVILPLIIDQMDNSINNILNYMEKISFFLSLSSLFISSHNNLGFLDRIKIKLYRLSIFILFAFIFRIFSSSFH